MADWQTCLLRLIGPSEMGPFLRALLEKGQHVARVGAFPIWRFQGCCPLSLPWPSHPVHPQAAGHSSTWIQTGSKLPAGKSCCALVKVKVTAEAARGRPASCGCALFFLPTPQAIQSLIHPGRAGHGHVNVTLCLEKGQRLPFLTETTVCS